MTCLKRASLRDLSALVTVAFLASRRSDRIHSMAFTLRGQESRGQCPVGEACTSMRNVYHFLRLDH